jgi:hypothetical protein
MRLRPLSEAECYARCYGGHGDERVSLVRLVNRPERNAARLQELHEGRRDDPREQAA